MALSQKSSSQMTQDLMGRRPVILESQTAINVVDGATTERRIRISQPDEGRGRCKGSRAWDRRKNFSQSMPQSTTLSTFTSACILVQGKGVFRVIVILHTQKEHVAQVPLAKDDDVIKAFPPDRALQPFRMAILPWRLGRGWPVTNAHGAK